MHKGEVAKGNPPRITTEPKSPGAFGIIVEITIDRALLHKPFLSPD